MRLKVATSLCSTDSFSINGVSANSSDFGDGYDHDEENAEDYGCGDMRFDRKPSTDEVLKKYHITESEYSEVCDVLEEKLSFGECGWCV